MAKDGRDDSSKEKGPRRTVKRAAGGLANAARAAGKTAGGTASYVGEVASETAGLALHVAAKEGVRRVRLLSRRGALQAVLDGR